MSLPAKINHRFLTNQNARTILVMSTNMHPSPSYQVVASPTGSRNRSSIITGSPMNCLHYMMAML